MRISDTTRPEEWLIPPLALHRMLESCSFVEARPERAPTIRIFVSLRFLLLKKPYNDDGWRTGRII